MNQRGFSLVELSIVLVILGLLTGGILAGQSLIKAAQLRSVSSEYARYTSALAAFKDKYFSLPGDMNNAQSFWGVDPGGCPGTNATATTPRSTTCNGDGNGRIEMTATTANESYRAWQQLANAGLIEGSYTGVTNNATANVFGPSLTTPNVPPSRYPNGLWQPIYWGVHDYTSGNTFEGDYMNALLFGGGANGRLPLLTTEEAWNLDMKMDDGKPGTGRLTSYKTAAQANATTGCSNIDYTIANSIAASSAYLLSNTAAACAFIFKTGM